MAPGVGARRAGGSASPGSPVPIRSTGTARAGSIWGCPASTAPTSSSSTWAATGRRCVPGPSRRRCSTCSTAWVERERAAAHPCYAISGRAPVGRTEAPDAASRERRAPACGAAASQLAGQETAMTLLRTQLGHTLRGHRLNQRRTLRDVSGAARVSLGYLSEVERGQKEASSELLASICDALDVELADLLAEVSQELRGAAVRPAVHSVVPAAAPAAEPAPQPAAAEPAAVAEPALALVGAGSSRAALRRGAVSLAA